MQIVTSRLQTLGLQGQHLKLISWLSMLLLVGTEHQNFSLIVRSTLQQLIFGRWVAYLEKSWQDNPFSLAKIMFISWDLLLKYASKKFLAKIHWITWLLVSALKTCPHCLWCNARAYYFCCVFLLSKFVASCDIFALKTLIILSCYSPILSFICDTIVLFSLVTSIRFSDYKNYGYLFLLLFFIFNQWL